MKMINTEKKNLFLLEYSHFYSIVVGGVFIMGIKEDMSPGPIESLPLVISSQRQLSSSPLCYLVGWLVG